MMSLVVKFAPLVAAYWLHIIAAGLLLAVSYLLLHRTSNNKGTPASLPRPQAESRFKDKGDNPLAEFEEEKQDPSQAPPLHSKDTPHIPYTPQRFSADNMILKSREYYRTLNKRRSVRFFSKESVPLEVIENVVRAAGTAPSGAHCEPWTFVVIRDPKIKSQIRDIVEQEEYLNYDRRMGDKWVNDLQFVRTTNEKLYLEEAPYIIIIMKQQYHIGEGRVRHPHYYYEISTAIAAGFLLTAIHMAGLVTVTTTPLNAGVALRELLGRPDSEKVMLLLPVGFPAEDATVPDISRKPLEQIMVIK